MRQALAFDDGYPADLELDMNPFRRMARGELDRYSVEKRFIHKEGHDVWARLTLLVVRDALGQLRLRGLHRRGDYRPEAGRRDAPLS